MVEVWKPIKDFSNYEVSNLGRVRSKTHFDSMGRLKEGKILKPSFDGKGHYLHVHLYANGKLKSINIHRLVAMAFIENPLSYPEVNHKDEDKTNNCISNLEWCTHKYNNNFGSKKGSVDGIKNPMNKITPETVAFIRNNHKILGGKLRTKELAEKFNISTTHVSAIVHGRRWNHANTM